ncbi:MAG: bifunctional diguanylate cyclase/phosphodiesterase [Beijerinckiaceae bacterium]|nr:bifunctional diguanylate cyclase/phosphodiesterase [Beijerinckiaceae bacterium]
MMISSSARKMAEPDPMPEAQSSLASEGLPPESHVLESISRIGAELFGMPVGIVQAGTGKVVDPMTQPSARFTHDHPLVDSRGMDLGRLALRDLTSHSPLDAAQQALLDNLGAIASGYLEARRFIGETDHVTLLPNRHRLIGDMALAAGTGAAHDDRCLLLVTLADARSFNEILRALGHSYAEDFIRAGAQRLRAIIPKHIALYHVSLLSLAIALPAEAGVTETLADEIVRAFAAPLACNGISFATRIGVGLCDFKATDRRTAEYLRSALTAAQDSRQKESGWSRYDRQSDEAHRRAFMILRDLDAAIAGEGQLTLNFQPRVSMPDGRCKSAEALLRWHHPTLGHISPGEFIPIVETTTLMRPLTQWVCRSAIAQVETWRRQGIDLTMAVNVSPNNLREGGFAGTISDMLDRAGVEPSCLELEFTEGALTGNEPAVNGEIEQIRRLGIDIAIDDFGTGYSNLSYLSRLPVQIIKIDQSFVRTLTSDPRQQLLVKSVLDMGHSLGFRIVAEGIETTSAYDMLNDWGCEEGQGYLMSRPLVAPEFAAWFKAKNA